MINHSKRRSFLFIEPCLSSQLLIHQANIKGYRTFVISTNESYLSLPKENFMAPSAFFQVDVHNEETVLNLVHQIAEKFKIDGIIPGYQSYGVLAAKISDYLKKPGLSPEVAFKIQRKDLLKNSLKEKNIYTPKHIEVNGQEEIEKITQNIGFPCVLKSFHHRSVIRAKKVHNLDEACQAYNNIRSHLIKMQLLQREILIEEYINGQEYNVNGLIKNKCIHIVSFIEKFFSPEADCVELGYIVRSEVEAMYLKTIKDCLQKVVVALNLDYGFFSAKVKISEKDPILLSFDMNMPNYFMPVLINYATGIDYYDNIFQLFSAQALSLSKLAKTNAGIIFFYKKFMRTNDFDDYLTIVLQNPMVIETKRYFGKNKYIQLVMGDTKKIGHAILIHQDRNMLKYKMKEIITNKDFYFSNIKI